MLLSALLGGLVAAAIFQPTATRLFAAVVFVSVAWAHEIAFAHLTGLPYYLSAGGGALLIIVALKRLAHPTPTVFALVRICLASLVLNFAGWIMWRAYLPPEPYNAAMFCVFSWALVILLSRDKQDASGGRLTMDLWRAGFRRYAYPRVQLLPRDGA
jgi:hypothetical protein